MIKHKLLFVLLSSLLLSACARKAQYNEEVRYTISYTNGKVCGDFICKKTILSLFNGRIVLFRADNSYHQITPITKGTRWLLSFGVRL